jgi:hypothetical protein
MTLHTHLTGSYIHNLLDTEGGFTLNPLTGEAVTTGFAVAFPHSLGIEGVDRVYYADVERLIAYAQGFTPDTLVMIGGWKHEGKYYVELTQVLPNRYDALRIARVRKQLAIYDLGERVEIPVRPAEEVRRESACQRHLSDAIARGDLRNTSTAPAAEPQYTVVGPVKLPPSEGVRLYEQDVERESQENRACLHAAPGQDEVLVAARELVRAAEERIASQARTITDLQNGIYAAWKEVSDGHSLAALRTLERLRRITL